MYTYKFLSNVCSVNQYEQVRELRFIKGNQQKIFFQLCKDDRRYMPEGDTNAVIVSFDSLDDDLKIERSASQPYADDKSIWCVIIGAGDCIGYDAMSISVVETVGGMDTTICFQQEGELVIVPKGQDKGFM